MQISREFQEQLGAAISYQAVKSFWKGYAEQKKVGTSRERYNVIHRHAFMHIAREHLYLTTVMIGRVLGKDHATVVHACKKHESNYRWDGMYRSVWDNMNDEMQDMLLVHGIVPKSIEHSSDVTDVHFKFIDVSRRLRSLIQEFSEYKVAVARDLKRVKEFKEYTKGIQKRNDELNQELLRLKKLL